MQVAMVPVVQFCYLLGCEIVHHLKQTFSFFLTVTTQKFVPAAAPDPKSTVICYAVFVVTGKDSSNNGGVGRDKRLFLRVTTGRNPTFL